MVGQPLREIPVQGATMSRWLGAMYRRDAYLSPACRRMIDIIASLSKTDSITSFSKTEHERPSRAPRARASAPVA